jgi:predicted dehydrogenase
LGGGQFFSHGCHYVDLLLWFLGDPLEGAHFGTNLGTPWMIKEGTSTMSMKFKSGATAMHYGTWGAKGTKMGYQYQIFTTSGKVLVLTKNQVRVYYNAERWAREDNDPTYVRDDGTFLKNAYKDDGKISKYEVVWQKQNLGPDIKNLHGVIAEFIDCVQTGRESFTSGRRALESLRTIWKMYQAEENHVIADLSDIVAPR